MKSNALNIFQLFSPSLRLAMPIFQRGYVWSESANWVPLWSDIVDAWRSTGESHFLGVIVLEQELSQTGYPGVRRVIDGQQRLTTIQVVLAVIRDIAAATGDLELVADLAVLIANAGGPGTDETFKVWPSQGDRAPFRRVVTAGGLEAVCSGYPAGLPALARAYRFFHKQITELMTGRPADQVSAILREVAEALCTGLTVVVLDLDPTDDPQTIFGSLNSLGTRLRPGDLVRNHLFHECKRIGLDAEDLHDRHWSAFDAEYWQAHPPGGPADSSRLDAFLSDYLILETRTLSPTSRVFHEFRHYLRGCGLSLEGVLVRLSEHGRIHASLDTGDGLSSDEWSILRRLRDTQIHVTRPLLMGILIRCEGKRRLEALRTIESYVLRRHLINRSSRRYGDLSAALVSCLDDDAPGPAMAAVLLGRTGEEAWPTDKEVIDWVARTQIFAIAPRRVLTLLLMVEDQLRRRGNERVEFDVAELTIEHLMPQRWDEQEWPLTETDPVAQERERRDRAKVIHTLGNLTLVTENLNKLLGNRNWAEKLPMLMRGSLLRLNQRLPPTLDPSTIRSRSAHLGHVLCELLPRPTTPGPGRRDSARPGS
jgi:hypothetical protein